MANTRETLGDEATLDGLVNNTLTTLEEDGVTSLGNYALYYRTALTSVKFPELLSTGSYAFQNCTGLTTIPSTSFPKLTTVNSYAFSNCTNLTSATFPAVTNLQSSAFQNCTNLTTVDLTGSSAVNIQSPFNSCSKLESLIVRSTTMSTINSNGLSGTKIAMGNGAVYVPTDLVNTYKANSNWNVYFIADINDYPITDFSTITDSWAAIIANSNYATDYSIGDTKQIDLGTEGVHYAQLVAINSDVRSDGDTTQNNGKARMTWILKTLLATNHNMNASAITTGGWQDSAMRSYLSTTVKPLMPEAVRNALVSVTKYSSTYENNAIVANGQTTSDELWIPSAQEIFGGSSYETSGVDYTTLFNSNSARIKYTTAGSAYNWWLRSANSASTFRCVFGSGNAGGSNAHYANGVALGFCI